MGPAGVSLLAINLPRTRFMAIAEEANGRLVTAASIHMHPDAEICCW